MSAAERQPHPLEPATRWFIVAFIAIFAAGLVAARWGAWALLPLALAAVALHRARQYRQTERGYLASLAEAATLIGNHRFKRPVAPAEDRRFDQVAAALAQRHDGITAELDRIQEADMAFAAVFDALYGPAIQVDHDGIVQTINRSVSTIFQIAPDEAKGRPFLHVVRDHRIEEALEEALTTLNSVSLDVEVVAARHPGRYRVRIEPMVKKDGTSIGAVVLLFDVTRLRFLERVRSEFVSNISHELRTPITAVKGFIETILEEDLPNEDRQRFLHIVKEEVDRLEGLLGDLLDLSLLESDTTPLNQEWIDIADLVRSVVTVMRPHAEHKSITIELSMPDALPAVPGNRKMLEQAVMNLVENGIKYTEDGGKVWIESRRIAGEHFELAVCDNGEGIPSEHLPRVFERFHRVDKARSRAEGGTGLGLAIVRHIIHRHGGSVRAESRLGKGSRFIVTLPLTPSEPRPSEWEE